MVLAIVVLAIYVSLGRLLSTNLRAFQDEILLELNRRVPFDIAAESLGGEWRSFTPEIVLTGLTLSAPGGEGEALELSGGRVGLDVLESLLSRSLQVRSVRLDNLALKGELTADGRLVLPGLTGDGGEIGAWLRNFLLNIEHVTLRDNSLLLALPGGGSRRMDLDLQLARAGSTRDLSAELLSEDGASLALAGRGVGNPFEPQNFTGDLFVSLRAGDLGALRDLLAETPPVLVRGALESDIWLAWDRGEPRVDFGLAINDLLLSPEEGSWSLPVEALSLEGSLIERKNRWTLFLSELAASHGDAEVLVPRMQVDAWGESLRVRSADVALAPLNALALELGALPANLAAVLDTLQPQGRLAAVEISIGDLAAPAASWDVEANFEDVAVKSWRGAPGVTAATGYLELSETGGSVVLDSQQFTMHFPTVYRDPLYYDDFYGTLNLDWDDDALVLHSGAITAEGVEGKALALFRLNIPFGPSDTGLEMDLMVGLENSHPIHRAKYVPYTLNGTLLEWLSGAVGEGDVEEAAFVWRGSLRRGASDLRTVQLFLNVANTRLDYHPQWPGVRSVEGVVLIDDTSVSVWADSARLYDSVARRLSAEAWLSEGNQMMLAVEGELTGPAADGLRVVNESLLGELTGGAFSAWQAQGDLETQLQLQINLADKRAPPVVELGTRWREVDLRIQPAGLQVDALSGELNYNSSGGFSSRDLAGTLWGEPVSALVRQSLLEPASGAAIDFGNSAIDVDLSTRVDAAALRDWLDLDALALSQGAAAVTANVRVIAGEQPLLSLSSDLVGVGLDLPPPWARTADAASSLQVALPLGAGRRVLSLALEDELRLQMGIAGGALDGASLGIGVDAPPVIEGEVRVAGNAPLLDVDAWLDFRERYLAAPAPAIPTDPNEPAGTPAQAQLALHVDRVQAERVRIRGIEASDVLFSFDFETDAWQVAAETGWLRGSLRQPSGDRASLALDYLDLAGLDKLATPEQQDAPVEVKGPDIPPLDVAVARLDRDGIQLGELGFRLDTEGGTVHARDITGNLAGMAIVTDPPASLTWERGVGTRLDAGLTFADFGDTLEQLGYASFLETREGNMTLALEWPGSPRDFSLVTAAGGVSFSAEEGRFLETPAGATGALKVVAILNLAEVVQRLSLSHMFESGIGFNTLDGEVKLHGGVIEVDGMELQGASSGFAFSGKSDIASRSLDGELVATLPVANNLPWVAALAGGLPVAAGVFVVSKVFEKQVNRLSSGVYSVGGSWDDPEVTFDRIFDDESRQLVRQLLDPNAVTAAGAGPVPDPNESAAPDPNAPPQSAAP